MGIPASDGDPGASAGTVRFQADGRTRGAIRRVADRPGDYGPDLMDNLMAPSFTDDCRATNVCGIRRSGVSLCQAADGGSVDVITDRGGQSGESFGLPRDRAGGI